jgi:hypothetical protein
MINKCLLFLMYPWSYFRYHSSIVTFFFLFELGVENRTEETEQVLVMSIVWDDYYNQNGIHVFFQWYIYVRRKDIM